MLKIYKLDHLNFSVEHIHTHILLEDENDSRRKKLILDTHATDYAPNNFSTPIDISPLVLTACEKTTHNGDDKRE